MSDLEQGPAPAGPDRSRVRRLLRAAARARGVLVTPVLLTGLVASERLYGEAPRPILLMLLATSYAGHVGGVLTGLFSAGLCIASALFLFHWPTHPTTA